MAHETLRIGQLADAVGVGVETLRYYEREGLLPKPRTLRSGYRQYAPQDVERVKFIKRAKELGFTLKETAELLELRVSSDKGCADVRTLAKAKRTEVARKIADLQDIEMALARLIRTCRGNGPTAECPFLDALGGVAANGAETKKG